MKKQKVFAFIDSQNLNLGVRSQGWKLDFSKFRLYLRNKYGVSRAYLFIGYLKDNEKLYKQLKNSGYNLVFKPTLFSYQEGKPIIKGNVDAELVLHSMIQYENYDKAIVVSGDGDFHCLIEYLEKNNKLLRVFAPNKHYSVLLHKFNKYVVRVDLLKDSLGTKLTKISGRSRP